MSDLLGLLGSIVLFIAITAISWVVVRDQPAILRTEPAPPTVLIFARSLRARFGLVPGQELVVEARTAIGSPRGDTLGGETRIVLTEDGILPRHATLSWENWSWVLLPLDPGAEVNVNGRAITSGTRLRSGDEVQLSHLVFRLEIR